MARGRVDAPITIKTVNNADIRVLNNLEVEDEYYRDQLKIRPKPIVSLFIWTYNKCSNIQNCEVYFARKTVLIWDDECDVVVTTLHTYYKGVGTH